MKRTHAFLLVLFSFLPPQTAFGAEPPAGPRPSVSLPRVEATGRELEATITVRGITSGPMLKSIDADKMLSTSTSRTAVDLWLLVDSSALCLKYSVDQRVSEWLNRLRSELPSESRVNLITFHRGSLEVVVAGEKPAAALAAKPRCQAAVSSDPERALERVLDDVADPSLHRAIWILSSGNVSISRKTLLRLKAAGAETSVFLYNPPLLEALNPLFEQMQATVGRELFHFQGLAPDSKDLPARTYAASASVPRGLAKTTGSFVAIAQSGDLRATSGTVAVKLDPKPAVTIWDRLFDALLWLLAATALMGAATGIYRYYTPRHCPKCTHRLRFEDQACAFCFAPDGAYLVGENPLGADGPIVQPLVTPLVSPVATIGTIRRSRIRVLRHRGEKRRVYFQIQRERSERSTSFRLVPGSVPVFVNNHPVDGHRYLASGDEIRSGRSRFRFVKKRRNENAMPA